MKVKNIFSSRNKSKKKKNVQQSSSTNEVSQNNTTDKLIIPPDTKDGRVSGKQNELSDVTNANSVADYSKEKVVMRSKVKKSALKTADSNEEESMKPRACSTSSNNSAKVKSSRRPWSFIEQLRRQDSRESAYSTGSSARTSQVVEDLAFSSLPPRDDTFSHPRSDATSHGSRSSCTLPRSITPEQFERVSKTATRQDNSAKRRTMDFRFFNFFKRSSSGDSSVHSDTGSSQANAGRSSFRGKNKGKKKGSKKRQEEETKSNKSRDSIDDTRFRSFSDGGETSATITFDESLQIPPPGLYDSAPRLVSVCERPEPTPEKVDRRVPINGEPAFYLGDDVTDSRQSSIDTVTSKGSRKYMRRSDPTSSHSILKLQMSEGSSIVRSSSDSADSSSRRSSFVCEPRDSPLPEDSIADFDSSAYLGARARKLYSGGSVPQIPHQSLHNQRIQRAMSNEGPGIGAQARCSQSVSNLATESADQSSMSIPRSSSDADNQTSNKRTPKPSPHQQKQDEQNNILRPGVSTDFIAPPSPVLRAIAYSGVVLRRNKQARNSQRPNSAYADQRMQHVMSLNMEDLPTYSLMRQEMTKGGANAYPSYEDIMALQESGRSTKRGSGGVHFATTASGRAKRRGATLSHYGQRASAGFATAASVEDGLDSLSSSNFGSKQSLSDYLRIEDDDDLNAYLGRKHAVTHTSSGNLRVQEPSSKRAKAIRKSVVSLANLISPGKPNQKGGKLQRSSSFKESGSTAPSTTTAAVYSFKPYRPPSNTPNKTKNNRRSKLWCETFDHTGLNEKEVKWQEAIFELYQGERDLVQDLTMAKQTYRDSMVTLKMLSDEEVTLIFGKLGCLLPLHEELLSKLEQARGEDGRTLAIGCIFVEWFPRISTAYREYCANQSDAKYALDAAVERDARVRDFLQRCLESPFSRKLDLWSYLDLPRTRLVKYPLLLQNVLKRTPVCMENERKDLNKVMDIIGEIIERVDETTGEQQCRYIRSKLEYLDDKQKSSFVDNSRLMLCSGQLKNNRGTKMHVFLFEEAFVLTRQTTRSNKISYQVYRHPLPLRTLVVDTNEGDKLSGSFRGGILSSEKVKHSFRVRSEELNVTYTLQASDEHDRKQWINAIQEAFVKYKSKHPEALENQTQISRRRATYDPSSKKYNNSRSVLRSSSDKSNHSVASSSDKSSLQEESQEDDASTTSEDIGPWRRTRSQTVNPSILTSKSSSSVSRKSSGSSTKSDKSISSDSKGSKKNNVDAKTLKDRLKHLENESDGPPSPLRDAPRKFSSISRHFSLTGADKPKVTIRKKNDQEEKPRNKCQRSRSLTASPQTVKSVVAQFGSKRLSHGKIGTSGLVVPTAAKPPMGPSASPFSVRRTTSLINSGTIHEAHSTPNLAASVGVGRSTSFCTRRSSSRLSQLAAQNCSNSVGNLRKGLAGGSASDLRRESLEKRAEDARILRRERSKDKASSEGDIQNCKVSITVEEIDAPEEDVSKQPPKSEVETDVVMANSEEKPSAKDQGDSSPQDSTGTETTNVECSEGAASDDVAKQSADEVMAEFCDHSADEDVCAQPINSSVDLISFASEAAMTVVENSDSTTENLESVSAEEQSRDSRASSPDEMEGIVMYAAPSSEDVEMKVVEDKEEGVQDLVKDDQEESEVVSENAEENPGEIMDCGPEDKIADSPNDGVAPDVDTTPSDVDNNNVQSSDKTQPDNETDEQIRVEADNESSNCCRVEITDENSNRQQSLQASV